MASKLGDYCNFQEGYVNPSQHHPEYFDGDVKWIRAVDLNNGFVYNTTRTLTSTGFRSAGKSALLFEPDTIVISKSGTIGRLGIIKDYMCGNRATINIRPKHNCDLYFVFYFLRSIQQYLGDLAVGSVQKNLYVSILENIEVAFPDLDTQRKIGQFMLMFDSKIETNNKINDNLQQQAAAIFREWFVANPETEKWPLVTLETLTSLVSRGITPKYADDSTQIVLNQKCIRDHYIDTSLARQHKPKVINEKWLQYGDLLINSTGEGTLGRAAQVWFLPKNMTIDSHITIVRPKNQLLLFYIGLWGITHEREIEALHTGSTGQTELPRDRVKAMELRQPGNDTLARFNSIIKPMVSAIVANQQENARLVSIRDALLPKLMSGEINVSSVQC